MEFTTNLRYLHEINIKKSICYLLIRLEFE